LFSTGVTIAYFVKASMMHRMYLCWRPAASIGPKRSAWMRMFGCSGVGSGCSGGGLSVDDFRRWQVRHVFICLSMSE
jgi:hypothetical protein